MHLYNPLTVLMLKEVIIKGNHKNVIHSSNDEVINRLLQRLCRYFKVNFSNFNNENAKKNNSRYSAYSYDYWIL